MWISDSFQSISNAWASALTANPETTKWPVGAGCHSEPEDRQGNGQKATGKSAQGHRQDTAA